MMKQIKTGMMTGLPGALCFERSGYGVAITDIVNDQASQNPAKLVIVISAIAQSNRTKQLKNEI